MTREIPLTRGKVAIVDDEDYDFLMQWKWRYNTSADGREYAYRKSSIYMHRVILNAPSGMEADHRDGNGLNNTRNNLRLATHAQNAKNRRPDRRQGQASAYKGVTWHKSARRWRARIKLNGKRISLGMFSSELDAACAYNEAAQKYHGEFARLNDIP